MPPPPAPGRGAPPARGLPDGGWRHASTSTLTPVDAGRSVVSTEVDLERAAAAPSPLGHYALGRDVAAEAVLNAAVANPVRGPPARVPLFAVSYDPNEVVQAAL